MEIGIWLLWMILAALFIVGEIFTAGFFILWFGIGAAVAGVLAMFDMAVGWQLAAFVVVSLSLVVVSRKFANRITKPQPPGIGADRFIGQICVVLEDINNETGQGRVRLKSEEWRAACETDMVIPAGSKVQVVGVDGTHLIVKA